MDKAWHLRQDGKAFPVQVHIYCMDDDDLSSEAEAAAFIISSKSADQELAKYVLDAWMAIWLEHRVNYNYTEEDINNKIIDIYTPYHFQYALPSATLLKIHKEQNNYHDVDSLYEFIDKVRDDIEEIQRKIKRSLNQQFCRVRFGGQYDSVTGNNELWCRIASVEYNWADTIYEYVSNIYRPYNLSAITICRDNESDNTRKDRFYTAQDGVQYKHMPIKEFLEEEHEHHMYFENNICAGVINKFRYYLREGKTYEQASQLLRDEEINIGRDLWHYLLRSEFRKCIMSMDTNHSTIINRRNNRE